MKSRECDLGVDGNLRLEPDERTGDRSHRPDEADLNLPADDIDVGELRVVSALCRARRWIGGV